MVIINKAIITVVIVIIIVVGGYFLLKRSYRSQTPAGSQVTLPTTAPTSSLASPSGQTNEKAVVTLTGSGFEPSTITVKAGTTIVWTNKSGVTATVNSDNHPTHLLYPELNLGRFESGRSLKVTLQKPGTYTYHNHLNPSEKGTIIVE